MLHNIKKITDDITWVGGNDRRLAMFEGVYSVPRGVSYNSYLIIDDKTVLFDTVDKAVSQTFFNNTEYVLNGRKLDYLIIQHMEPDHSALIDDLHRRHPETVIVCCEKTKQMIHRFFNDVEYRFLIVKEGDILDTGHHKLHFISAPMVHWPEVTVTYDSESGILFSADAFGTFGALNGAIFADEVDFERDYADEARRYYCNIVGKYGTQVQSLLKKASKLEINMICPLHGFVWRKNISDYIEKYQKWSTYTPEETGVMIAYASVYGNTAHTAEVISAGLRNKGIKTVMFDVSVTPASEILAAAFKMSHLIFASTTYNAGIFISMEDLLRDLVAHNLQNRTVAFVENGTWAITSGKLMREILQQCKNMTFIEKTFSIESSPKKHREQELHEFINEIASTILTKPEIAVDISGDPSNFFKFSYGLFVLTAQNGQKDNGCIINTAQLLTDSPKRISVTVNKQNYTHDLIIKTGIFNLSILTESVPFSVFEHFGFQSGRQVDKFENYKDILRSNNGLIYLDKYSNACISGKVISTADYGTHTLFVADVTESKSLNNEPSVTYDYYFKHIKPKPQIMQTEKVGWVCKICGYFYEGKELPPDYICPLCKHGAEDFEFVG